MNFEVIPWAVQVVLLALVLASAAYDVRYRRIPNWLTMGGALAGLAVNIFVRQTPPGFGFSRAGFEALWPGFWLSLKGLLLGFGVYLLLYMLRAMGAGDVKLMGAVGSLLGPSAWFGVFLITAILGGIMAVIAAASKGRLKRTFWNVGFILSEMRRGRPAYLRREELDVKHPDALGLPHGAVIAVGTVFYLALNAHFLQ